MTGHEDSVAGVTRPRPGDGERAPGVVPPPSESAITQQILRWDVPVDDRPHLIGGGPVVKVAARHGRLDNVEVWTVELMTGGRFEIAPRRHVQVVGTGHPFPVTWTPLGTTLACDGVLVWHVLEVPPIRRAST